MLQLNGRSRLTLLAVVAGLLAVEAPFPPEPAHSQILSQALPPDQGAPKAKPGPAPQAPAIHPEVGSYLAGRIARGLNDTQTAASYYRRALDKDPGNETLLESAMIMETTEGEWDRAFEHASKLSISQPTHRLARQLLSLQAFKAGNYAAALDHVKAASAGAIGELTGNIARAWIHVAQGDVNGALDAIDGGRYADWGQFFVRYHRALVLDVGGRRNEALGAYERAFRPDARITRISLAYARLAAATGDLKQARAILDDHAKRTQGAPHPEVVGLQNRLKNGDSIEPLIRTAIEGYAELLYGLGEALSGDGGAGVSSLYLQMALYLKPDAPFALAALATIYEQTKRHGRAIETFDRMPKGLAMQPAIEIRKAHNLSQLAKIDQAKSLLEKLAAADPTDIRPLEALGNLMRNNKRYGESIDYYNRIIALIPRPEKRHWVYFYARGTSYERTKRWPQAEADLQRALKLAPDSPLVLNYLGYSWVDQNRNLKQGLAMIEKAVALRPDDGYIIDSLGWAHFRLGNFKEATRHLEKAVELKPEDPTLNDHLGDAYWRVGRELEARYQWRQALALKPEAEEIPKIERKIAEGMPPLKAASRVVRKTREAVRRESAVRKRSEGREAPQGPAIE